MLEEASQSYLDVYKNVGEALFFLESVRIHYDNMPGFADALSKHIVKRYEQGDRVEVLLEYKELFRPPRKPIKRTEVE